MNKKNRGTDAGGFKTNVNGLNFEKNIYLKDWIQKAGYLLKKIQNNLYEIYKDNKLIGYYGQQGQIYNALKKINSQKFNDKYIKKIFSAKIFPDSFILSINPRTLTIFEKKWQQTQGSVDEKIQTAPFKLEMFEKLLRGSKINCQYQYILSKWFKDPKYRNVKEYYLNNNKINIFIENENLDILNIEDYLK